MPWTRSTSSKKGLPNWAIRAPVRTWPTGPGEGKMLNHDKLEREYNNKSSFLYRKRYVRREEVIKAVKCLQNVSSSSSTASGLVDQYPQGMKTKSLSRVTYEQ